MSRRILHLAVAYTKGDRAGWHPATQEGRGWVHARVATPIAALWVWHVDPRPDEWERYALSDALA